MDVLPDVALELFQSTPSARRATHTITVEVSDGKISIHALREESDRFALAVCLCLEVDFNPRPPRGERQTAGEAMPLHLQISIHALREESDSTSVVP